MAFMIGGVGMFGALATWLPRYLWSDSDYGTVRGSPNPGTFKRHALDYLKSGLSPADKLRSKIDSGEYKQVVLGLIFLQYISDKDDDPRWQFGAPPLRDALLPKLLSGTLSISTSVFHMSASYPTKILLGFRSNRVGRRNNVTEWVNA